MSRDSVVDGDWLRATDWCHGYDRIIRIITYFPQLAKHFGWAACTEHTAQVKEFELILMVKMETRHPVEGSFESEFPSICNHYVVITYNGLKSQDLEIFEQFFAFFGKKPPLMVKFSKFCFPKGKFSPPYRSTLSCWNVVKFVRLKNPAASQTVATERIAYKICQGQPPTFGSHFARFHSNWFTYGGVIAERVNTVLLPCSLEYFHDSPGAKHRFGEWKGTLFGPR